MKIYCIQNKETYNVEINRSGGNYLGACPVCSSYRKNPGSKSFSFNVSEGVGKCHNCESSFVIYKELDPAEFKDSYSMPKKVYSRPRPAIISDLNQATIEWFNSRGINTHTLFKMRVTDSAEMMPKSGHTIAVNFNYYRDGELINVKYRSIAQKDFKMFGGGELIIYNLDGVKDSDKMIWCEGEMDQLSYYQAGLDFAVSVPNGATKSGQRLEYIDNCYDAISHVKTHYISTDDDEPGRALKDELVRRFGAENCKLIDLLGEKDANDFMMKYGAFELGKRFNEAKDIPLSGIYNIDENIDTIIDIWKRGLPPGLDTYHENINNHVTWVTGALAIWTGIPSHGKSEMLDEVNVHLNIKHGWKVAYFSPENFPEPYHVSKLVPKLSGKKFSPDHMSYDSLMAHMEYLKNNFFFIRPDDDNLSIQSILDHAKALIKRYGIKVLVIDPWNKLDHMAERGESETQYVSKALDKLIIFAQRNGILIHLVAHPTKMKKEKGVFEKPTLYDVNGSAHFYNKAFYGFNVYRNTDHTELDILKVKFRHLGSPGTVKFKFNLENGRYVSIEDPMDPVRWDNSSLLSRLNREPDSYDQTIFPVYDEADLE